MLQQNSDCCTPTPPFIQLMGIEKRDQLSRARVAYERATAASGYSVKRLNDSEAKDWFDFFMAGQVAASGVFRTRT